MTDQKRDDPGPADQEPTPRVYALRALQFLFLVTFVLFMLVATVLVLGQLVGTLVVQPAWVSALSEYLLIPAVSLASTFGVIAFLASYLRGGAPEEVGS